MLRMTSAPRISVKRTSLPSSAVNGKAGPRCLGSIQSLMGGTFLGMEIMVEMAHGSGDSPLDRPVESVYNVAKEWRVASLPSFAPNPGPDRSIARTARTCDFRIGPEIIIEPALTAEQSAERSLQLALAAAHTAAENRGQDIVLLDMREITPIFDYFLVVTGSSRRQLHAISEEIDHTLEDELGDQRMGIEGYNESHWILLDYGTVVIHLFDQETREYYALEDFWNAAARVPLSTMDGAAMDGAAMDGPKMDGIPGFDGKPATNAEPEADGEPGTETQ